MKSILFLSLLFTITSFATSEHYLENELNWPTHLKEGTSKIGPLMHQYQKFESNYFHEGVDFLGEPYQAIYTPVSGKIDGGYYSYKTLEDGTSKKTYISLRDIDPEDKEPKLWGDDYFEISVTDEYGYRFEFHHLDRATLPAAILNAIYKNGSVSKGSEVGSIIPWPNKVLGKDYHHVHYSIVSKEGVYLNPFWFSKIIKDSKPPEISSVFLRLEEKCSHNGLTRFIPTSQLKKNQTPTHIVLKVNDFLDNNHFPHPPTVIEANFLGHEKTTLDFRYYMLNENLEHYNLSSLYAKRFCIGDPKFPFVLDGSSSFEFYMKIKIPKGFEGNVDLKVSDYSGNQSFKSIDILKRPTK